MHNQIFSMKKSSRSIGRRNDKPSPWRGKADSPCQGEMSSAARQRG